MTEHSPTLGALFAALAQAQGEIGRAAKNAKNPHLRNNYADLGSVWDAIREPLSRHGVAVVQMATASEDGHRAGCITYVGHGESGEWIRGELLMPVSAGKGVTIAQAIGSVQTYARRYALGAAIGVTTGEDTDGGPPRGSGQDSAKIRPDPATPPKPAKKRESPPPAPPRDPDAEAPEAPHHPSWEEDRPRFCKWSEARGGYDAVRDWSVDKSGVKPSQMDGARRRKLQAYLATDAGKDDISNYLRYRNGPDGHGDSNAQ